MILKLIILIIGAAESLALHEAGHYVTARVLGYPARYRGLRSVEWGSDAVISPPSHRMKISAAGPAVSLLLAGVFALTGWWVLVDFNLIYCILNLLPLPNSDGRHIIEAADRV